MTKEDKIEIIESAFSINDISLKIYGYVNGNTIRKVKRFIDENDIDVSIFETKNKNRKYEIVSKKCPVCESIFETKLNHKDEKTTCSSSCANKYFKSKKNDSVKQKISKSLKKYYKDELRTYTRTCIICHKEFERWRLNNGSITKSKTCSIDCLNSQRSVNSKKSMLERIENGTHIGWMSRNKLSYPEKFFIEVLENNEIFKNYHVNYRISKRRLGIDCNSSYFLDFYFEDKKLDLEIDGKQHDLDERKSSDDLRDFYLRKNGINVYRIKWKSINSKNGKEYIKNEIDKFIEFYTSL